MISEKIKQIMKLKGIKANQLAEYMGIKTQSLTNKFARDSWSVQDLVSVLDFLGCRLTIELEPDLRIVFKPDSNSDGDE